MDDSTEKRILASTLDAFPKTHQSKDLKLSFDRKELARPAVGFGTVGDKDMMDHEEKF